MSLLVDGVHASHLGFKYLCGPRNWSSFQLYTDYRFSLGIDHIRTTLKKL